MACTVKHYGFVI